MERGGAEEALEGPPRDFVFAFVVHVALVVGEEEVLFFCEGVRFEGYFETVGGFQGGFFTVCVFAGVEGCGEGEGVFLGFLFSVVVSIWLYAKAWFGDTLCFSGTLCWLL